MRDTFKILIIAVLASILVRGFDVSYVSASLQSVPYVWNSTWEDDPAEGDALGEGDDHFRNLKEEIRGRAETEHFWGVNTGAADDGRHREGAARAFFQDAAPTTLTRNDYYNGTTGAADNALDEGRLWADSNNGYTLQVTDANGTFQEIVAVPTNGIILWAEANGDEDCDGTSDTAGDCPCGFTRFDAMDGLMARGALAAGADPNDIYMVPDTVGVRCDMSAPGTSVGAECNADPNTPYDDTLDIAELPLHGHPARYTTQIGGSGDLTGGIMRDNDLTQQNYTNTGAASATQGEHIGGTGGATEHQHPFVTVLFCKKS
jgi:microcystin-dependent protein